ncbi:hypothetical protein EMIHUDRAFT_222339 [Emiliania huxleyi CCMP1516]|uniref:ABC transporter domain-containing protein n=2 Tax=Emiliania huxleyi TaxID=2903 RepID=A0A0D3KYT8_EMIH1|nr:hypothetical protein EMIHUDRAFT_222339 [Emiliania huxleyi CCMP1516]EOD40923.1 hypothetical protein EMIHUDRAFT_222339 [Emiliania huxleyi CCMP1516]|eukprot:XP_005793352.1 hypothetical protein EMIHUDRAFT_222339 [Emiliania huxleyi CCMP1516]
MPARRPVLKVVARRTSDSCPFLNEELAFELCPGEVVWLRGASGAGKSYTSLHLAGLAKLPGAEIHMEWDPSVAAAQRIGFLFQKGVLIDSLSLAANLALAAEAAALPADSDAIAAALEAVGLSPSADGSKMPGELSGGMLRRAALAQILAQRKRVVILDEPFVGLDPPVAGEITALLKRVAAEHGIALPLRLLSQCDMPLFTDAADGDAARQDADLSGLRFAVRASRRFADYFFISAPLIAMAFAATGAALSMLLADMLQRVRIIATFLTRYLAGNPALPLILQLVDGVVKQNEAAAKRKLYALAIGAASRGLGSLRRARSVFTIELGPLLTALLLAGRIGGSYAGEAGDVAMMASTSQVDLLKALAAPLLSLLGTAVALLMGAVVGGGGGFDMISPDEYWREMRPLLLERPEGQHLLKFAPLVNVYRSLGFMLCTMGISQLCSRSRRRLQPRHVPLVITSAVVLSCLAILFLDWGFSQLFAGGDGRLGDGAEGGAEEEYDEFADEL